VSTTNHRDEAAVGARSAKSERERDEKIARLEQYRTALDADGRALLLELYPTITRTYGRRTWRVIRAWGVRDTDVEDVLQEILLDAFNQIIDHGIRQSLGATIGIVARGKLLHYLRDLRAEPDTVEVPVSGSWLPESERDLARAVDLRRLTERFLPELSDDHRVVVQRITLDGLSYAELALELGIPEGTLKARHHAAMEALRRLAAPWLPESQRTVG
jgi:RNA polymerase sigma-70 factor (ECF subfamily)